MVPPGSGDQQRHFDVHKERLRGNIWLWRWDEGLEAASKEVLQCREADGGQSSRSAYEAAPGIRGRSGRLIRSQSRADDAVERNWRSNHGHTVQCFGDLSIMSILWCKRAFNQPRRFQS